MIQECFFCFQGILRFFGDLVGHAQIPGKSAHGNRHRHNTPRFAEKFRVNDASALDMILASQPFHGSIVRYWYPGTSLISWNNKYGWTVSRFDCDYREYQENERRYQNRENSPFFSSDDSS